MTCGGCQGLGAHVRWCPEVGVYYASALGSLSERIEDAGDLIGPNNKGLTNRLYGLASELRAHALANIRSAPTPSTAEADDE